MIEVKRTEDGESVVVAGVTMTPDEAAALARRIDYERIMARDAAESRRRRENAEPLVAAWKDRNPGHIAVKGGFVRVNSRGVKSIGAASGAPMGIRLHEIPAYPTPVRMRVYAGRVAHIWQGGQRFFCGKYIGDPAEFRAGTPDCPRCAAELETRTGVAS